MVHQQGISTCSGKGKASLELWQTTQAHSIILIPLHLSHQIVQGRNNFNDKPRPNLWGSIIFQLDRLNLMNQRSGQLVTAQLPDWCSKGSIWLHKHQFRSMTLDDFDLVPRGEQKPFQMNTRHHIMHTKWSCSDLLLPPWVSGICIYSMAESPEVQLFVLLLCFPPHVTSCVF